jgi:hypothetical protein
MDSNHQFPQARDASAYLRAKRVVRAQRADVIGFSRCFPSTQHGFYASRPSGSLYFIGVLVHPEHQEAQHFAGYHSAENAQFVADSSLEGRRFEPSVPRQWSMARCSRDDQFA